MNKTPKKTPNKFEKTSKTPNKFEKTSKTPMKPVKTPKKSPGKQNSPKQTAAKQAFTPKKTPGHKLKTPKEVFSPKIENEITPTKQHFTTKKTPKVEVTSPVVEEQNKKGKNKGNKSRNQKALKRKLESELDDVETKTKKMKENYDAPEVKKRTLFVGNLPLDTSEKDVKDMFKKYGKIETIRFRGVPREDTKMSRKVALIKKKFHPKAKNMFCFVLFATEEMARKGLAANGTIFKTHHLRVTIAADKFEPKQDQCIFVGNLSFDCGEDELRDIFTDCGKIESVRIVKDRDTNVSRGFGFVNFTNTDAVELALQMENVKINKREIRIKRFGQKIDTLTQKSRSIHVSNIPVKTSRFKLYELFKDCGKIINMTFVPHKQKYSKSCIITFENISHADKALYKRTKIYNNALYIKKDRFEPATQIFLKNIPEKTLPASVKLALKDCGVIISVKLNKGKKEHKNGYGIVAFSTIDEANKAIELGSIEIAGVEVPINSYLSDSIEKFMEKRPEKKEMKKKSEKEVKKESDDEENVNEESDGEDDSDDDGDDDAEDDDDDDDDDNEEEDVKKEDDDQEDGSDDADDDDDDDDNEEEDVKKEDDDQEDGSDDADDDDDDDDDSDE